LRRLLQKLKENILDDLKRRVVTLFDYMDEKIENIILAPR
jgi:hypothetical protein